MNRFKLTFACVTLSLLGFGQQPWNTNMNDFTPDENPRLGTKSNFPLIFSTNSQDRIILDPDGNIKITSLAGSGSSAVIVDDNGNLQRIPPPALNSCGGTLPWVMGGNTPPFGVPYTANQIGTCNNTPFILKANNLNSVFIQPTGDIGINTSTPGSVLDITSRTIGNQSNFKIFGDLNGDVESSTDMRLHYNTNFRFEINQGTSTSPVPRLSIDATGVAMIYNKLDVGANMVPGTGARLGVDGKTSTGVLVVADAGNSGNGNMALAVANSAGAARLRLWVNSGGGDDTKMHIAGCTQIGFYQSPGNLLDNATRLNIDGLGGMNGVKVSTNNDGIKAFYIDNNNYPTTSPFIVYGNGRTQIGPNYPDPSGVAANAMLSVNGMILAKDIRVAIAQTTHWKFPDYVFEKNYKLMPLKEVEEYVVKNKHLPGVPSEAEVLKDGLSLTEINIKLLQKVEELYLHSIELKKQNDKLEARIEKLSSEIKAGSK